MQPFTLLRGTAALLPLDNVDTDLIIRIERLTSLARGELGPWAFESLRYRADGSEDPAFALNQAGWREAPILVAGRNFGCGSSREGAVWALLARGIRCVIAASFGDIFQANCFQNGVLPIRLEVPALAQVKNACSPSANWEVDLRTQRLMLPDSTVLPFEVDPLRRAALLEGLDDIGRTLKLSEEIERWQENDRATRPWAWPSSDITEAGLRHHNGE
ncbi:3-isopropylmalate dehydratase small subunit [Variovorax dokdonensis]|uniref:3-isopropylmalate dehydratase n=1 Tax=Variovorax dokdonensis TaxID=344883 RepID=A0ABT7NAP2_9BURK|nr:3-isopropylmalate dehydratase small subunit [Variovorax dokdonensis]MDM0045016.1 3-isopropylmalate dehydratase small subunit [Variovorax dokdonensis]